MKHFIINVTHEYKRYRYHVKAESQWKAVKIFENSFPNLKIKSCYELINIK